VTLAASGVVIIGLLVVVVVLLTTDDAGSNQGGTAGSSPKGAPSPFTVAGDITLDSYDGVLKVTGGVCTGQNGYDDMSAGAQVVVADATGKTIAVGALESGVSESGSKCRFPFSIENVPEGEGPFSVQVSHRGSIAFSRADAGDLHFTLGTGA
jgi:hypothetical protein